MTSIDSNRHHAGTPEPTLTDLNEEFSEHWDIWRGTRALYYATRHGTSPPVTRTGNPPTRCATRSAPQAGSSPTATPGSTR